jgi:hypothetical protein
MLLWLPMSAFHHFRTFAPAVRTSAMATRGYSPIPAVEVGLKACNETARSALHGEEYRLASVQRAGV